LQSPLGGSPEQRSKPGVQSFSQRHVMQLVDVGLLQPLVAHFSALQDTLAE